MQYDILKEIGLTNGEVKVYLALIKLGLTKTGALAVKAGVSSSKVYRILENLEKKGLVGHIIKQGVKHYTALDSKKILDYIDDKESELQKQKQQISDLIPKLNKERNSKIKHEAVVLSGFKAVTTSFNNILEELKAGDSYSVIGVKYDAGDIEKQKKFFYKFHQKRAQKKIKLKMLVNYNSRNEVVKPTFRNAEVRFLPASFLPQMNILFYRDKTLISFWGEEIFGFLIESQPIAESFQLYFDTFWKTAKK